jgi:AcrR family transcriptional regulator
LTKRFSGAIILTGQYYKEGALMPSPDKRQLIMRAAEQLFTSGRIHEITLDEVTRVAKVGKGTIYQYFKDKDDLFFQVAISGFDELCELAQRKTPEKAPFARQLLDTCEAISCFFEKRRKMFDMMQAEDARMALYRGKIRARWLEHRKKLVSAVAAIMRNGACEGILRSDVEPEVLASYFLGMLRTRARDLRESPEETRGYELLIDLFCNGAGCPMGEGRKGQP